MTSLTPHQDVVRAFNQQTERSSKADRERTDAVGVVARVSTATIAAFHVACASEMDGGQSLEWLQDAQLGTMANLASVIVSSDPDLDLSSEEALQRGFSLLNDIALNLVSRLGPEGTKGMNRSATLPISDGVKS